MTGTIHSEEDSSDTDYSPVWFKYSCIFCFQETQLVDLASDLPAMDKTLFLQRATWEPCQVYAAQLRNGFYAQKTTDHQSVIEVVIASWRDAVTLL